MNFDQGFGDALRGSLMQERHMDMISNNLANVSTPGYKQERLIFDELMQRELRTDFEQGPLVGTNRPLDVAIMGDGFFRVQTPQGERLSRNGSFQVDAQGNLITVNGYQVMSADGGPITLDPDGGALVIDEKGRVTQGTDQIGAIAVVDVADRSQVVKEGANMFGGVNGQLPPTTPATAFTVAQGSLEGSNVEAVEMMVDMITAHRAFESYQKCMQAMQEVDLKAINQVGRVG